MTRSAWRLFCATGFSVLALSSLPSRAAGVANGGSSDGGGAAPSESMLLRFDGVTDSIGNGENARIKAIAEAGFSSGAQSGFASEAGVIFDRVNARSSDFDRIYSFQPLIDGRGVLPPVVSEANDSVKIANEGMRLTAAGKVYRILRPGRLVDVVPGWRDYLFLGMGKRDRRFDSVPKLLKPKNSEEQKVWEDNVKAGWLSGVDRARSVYAKNMARLNRDYLGMARYRKLLAMGMIDSPVVAVGVNASRVTDSDVSLDVVTKQMVNPAKMNSHTEQWHPDVTYSNNVGRSSASLGGDR